MTTAAISELRECLVCGAGELVRFLDLGRLPLVNSLLRDPGELASEPRYPLAVYHCARCLHVQLGQSVDPADMFSEYLYFTGNSESVITHARALASLVEAQGGIDRQSLVVEIASNDGTVLEQFKAVSDRVLGVEPARNVAGAARARGIPTVEEFFTEPFAAALRREEGPAAVVLARNVLAHVPALRGFIRGIAVLLDDDGVALIEVPYLGDLLSHLEFDTVYHEHLSYFSVSALDRLLGANGLELIDVNRLPLHGGSLLLTGQRRGGPRPRRPAVDGFLAAERKEGWLTPAALGDFARRVERLVEELRHFVADLHADGKRIAGYGASAKGNVLLNVARLTRHDIEFLVDRSVHKQGRFAPGTGIPIHPVERLYQTRVDCLLLLAWNFADEIVRQQARFEAQGGRFVIPVPRPQFIGTADIGRADLGHLDSVGIAAVRTT